MNHGGYMTGKNARAISRASFTLLELLIVIGIIALLAGILLPVLTAARKFSKRVTAREDLTQLVTVWNTYLTDYRQFPDMAISDMDTNVVSILLGTHTNYNTAKHHYMDFTTEEMTNGFRDPWGELYIVSLDNGQGDDKRGYDGYVIVNDGTGKVSVATHVAAWSKGPDKADGSAADRVDNVKSW